jgi:fumarylpyruvate hydrolase
MRSAASSAWGGTTRATPVRWAPIRSGRPPFFFAKASQHLVQSGDVVAYPPGTEDFHHEIELVVALGAPVFDAGPEAGWEAVFAYGVGLDMTRRDLQAEAKATARPWFFGKDFEGSAIASPLRRLDRRLTEGSIQLSVNTALRQDGDLGEMIWNVGEIVGHLSRCYHLGPGDLIFTGTPAGVGSVLPGDHLTGSIEGVGTIEVRIGEPEG